MNWPPPLTTIKFLVLISNGLSNFHQHSANGKITCIHMHLQRFVKLWELEHEREDNMLLSSSKAW